MMTTFSLMVGWRILGEIQAGCTNWDRSATRRYDLATMLAALFIETLSINPPYFFATVIAIVISIVLHELAHGWVAIRHGDDTPIETGHMTLNPIVHMGI